MTELAYQRDTESAYVQRFDATVVALPPGAVVLDRTFFYAVGGGQPADRGTLTGPSGARVEVVDVARSAGEVLHRIGRRSDARSLRVGETVQGEIDWRRRHEHMRLHTAQHLASALLFRRFARRTDRAVLGNGAAVIDLEEPLPESPEVEGWVEEFQTAVAADRPVAVRHIPRTEYERSPAPRSGRIPLPAGIDSVRLIEIEGYDASPCGGTHVRSTGEIGTVRFTSTGAAQSRRVGFQLESRDAPPTRPG